MGSQKTDDAVTVADGSTAGAATGARLSPAQDKANAALRVITAIEAEAGPLERVEVAELVVRALALVLGTETIRQLTER